MRILLAILFLAVSAFGQGVRVPGPGGASAGAPSTLITKIAEGTAHSTLGTTDPAILSLNCATANFAIIWVSNNVDPSGSKPTSTSTSSGDWHFGTFSPANGTSSGGGFWYAYNVTLASPEVFTEIADYPGIFGQCYKNVKSSGDPVDSNAFTITDCTTSTTCALGSAITPDEDNEVCVFGLFGSSTSMAPVTVDGSYSTPVSANTFGGAAYGGAISNWIQTTATATQPTFTASAGSINTSNSLACFKKTP